MKYSDIFCYMFLAMVGIVFGGLLLSMCIVIVIMAPSLDAKLTAILFIVLIVALTAMKIRLEMLKWRKEKEFT